jgi:hypothetical protein
MKRFLFFALLLSACHSDSGTVDASVTKYIKEDTLAIIPQTSSAVPAKAIAIEEGVRIDSTLFERSIFRDLGCARDFWMDRKGPECCCEAVLTNYAEVIKTMSAKRIAALNAKDPILKKCRLKVKNWGQRFDDITNPPSDIKETDDDRL